MTYISGPGHKEPTTLSSKVFLKCCILRWLGTDIIWQENESAKEEQDEDIPLSVLQKGPSYDDRKVPVSVLVQCGVN